MLELTEKDSSVTFRVRVQPRASRSEVVGEYGGAIKVRIAAPPVDNQANDECRRFLAKRLGVSASDIEILSGNSSREKLIRVYHITAQQVRALLSAT